MVFCRRCGQASPTGYLLCVHRGECVGITEDRERALRTRARYEFGKRFNPEHDTTDYYAEEVA